ncbi:hypothetical protein Cgig2_024915 [Carnegiea gigantea]|uniref:Uncharacterized protein n=1 Tax=Carnegiea gigantea TaxID=171969 RepID=A0A9Q1KE42_9CARY|nr:hypothetical protein Cgig2_024915 [Carnegiea gigantea]
MSFRARREKGSIVWAICAYVCVEDQIHLPSPERRRKIAGVRLLIQNESESNLVYISDGHSTIDKSTEPDAHGHDLNFFAVNYWFNWICSSARRGKLNFNFWKDYDGLFGEQSETTDRKTSTLFGSDGKVDTEEPYETFPMFSKQSFKAIISHFSRKWHRRLSFIRKLGTHVLRSIWNIAGVHLNLDIPKWLQVLYLDRLNSIAVQCLERKIKAFEPTYLYTKEKASFSSILDAMCLLCSVAVTVVGYFLLPEEARARHNIGTANISISARHSCFGNRWQQLLINRVVGYDTILMNSLLDSPGQGYLYNYQTTEFYNLSYAHAPLKGSATFGDYLVTKCGVLMMSLFVFFTTTMSVSFTLRETQTRMLKFTESYSLEHCYQIKIATDLYFSQIIAVQLQHHARYQLPTFQLIFVHVIESLVFVPIMIGILFFLFEFYDDQLLAFMVLILVWLCEIFTLIRLVSCFSSCCCSMSFSFLQLSMNSYALSWLLCFPFFLNCLIEFGLSPACSVRTPISMKFFPRFFLLYFLVFHIYFFSYAYGFSYLALSTTAAFMLHLILYFWNRFEVPALQRFLQSRRSQMQQHPDFHITSSTILTSTLRITRLNTRVPGPIRIDAASGSRTLRLRPNVDVPVPPNIRAEASGRAEHFREANQQNENIRGDPLPMPDQPEAVPNPANMNSFSSLLLWILGGASSESLNSLFSIFRDGIAIMNLFAVEVAVATTGRAAEEIGGPTAITGGHELATAVGGVGPKGSCMVLEAFLVCYQHLFVGPMRSTNSGPPQM